MEYRIICRAGIKTHKGSLLGIAILLFLMSLSLTTVLVIYLGGGEHIRQEIKRTGFGNLTAWVSEVPDMKALTDSMEAQEGIQKTEVQNLIFSSYKANGVESDSEGQLIPWSKGDKAYHFLKDSLTDYVEVPDEISQGTVYVPPAMVSIMGLKIGDTITFPVVRGSDSIRLTVAGYYEDPFMGSTMIGMKGFLISETDYNRIISTIDQAGMERLARAGAMIHIFTKTSSHRSVSDMNQLLNESTTISQYTEFIHSEEAIKGFMSILQNAFCALFAAFSIILLAASMVVLGHSISSIMEQEYKNIGILKTVGLRGNQLIGMQLIQYTTAICTGILAGVLTALPTSRAVGRLTITTTGIRLPGDLPILPCVAVFAVILLLLITFTVAKLKTIILVTPMGAIRGETSHLKWNTKKVFPMSAKGFPLQLALRQIMSGKKRYVSACLIAVLLVFFASLTGRMNAWLGPEGEGMMDAFNPADLDIGVQTLGELDPEKMENMVRSYTDITDRYLLAMPSVSVDGSNYTANVITEPERFHISKGETSKREDQVVLTESASSDLGAGIGDKVTIGGDTGSREFIVSGIYHCANDMGANIGLSREGYLSIARESPGLWCYHYFIAEPSEKEAITKGLEAAYGGDVHVHKNSWPGLNGIVTAMQGLLVFMYTMIAVFVLTVTVLAGSKILKAEQKDLGIYKSMGCSTEMLRLTFSLRFGMVAFLGAAGGTILSAILTDSLVSAVMRLAGISNFESQPNSFNIVIPGLSVIFLFIGFSYLSAGRIKKSDVTILTAD